ncbi:predicted protein [Histoplasma mississippiense (nom. inval.)]|uniref:predicted protein n=1 Tax=Ajellomyces capsulatus (strain NAm1 / WU24) TaxID=2059318 RepID=UPI000157BD20|nr:predicted protein [Histoplasma mississippiense (nom. inval.)]EDN06267.1 predicted protein [Histoplasma mississippiense (nom. inval.)]
MGKQALTTDGFFRTTHQKNNGSWTLKNSNHSYKFGSVFYVTSSYLPVYISHFVSLLTKID